MCLSKLICSYKLACLSKLICFLLAIEKTLAYYEICHFPVNYESVMFYSTQIDPKSKSHKMFWHKFTHSFLKARSFLSIGKILSTFIK